MKAVEFAAFQEGLLASPQLQPGVEIDAEVALNSCANLHWLSTDDCTEPICQERHD
jgi:hypothetical protein